MFNFAWVGSSEITFGAAHEREDEGDLLADSLDITYGAPPVCKVEVTGEVDWKQQASGRSPIFPEKC